MLGEQLYQEGARKRYIFQPHHSDAGYYCAGQDLDLAECTTAGLVLNTQGHHRDKSKRQGSPNKPTNNPTAHIDPPGVPQDQPPSEWVSNQTAPTRQPAGQLTTRHLGWATTDPRRYRQPVGNLEQAQGQVPATSLKRSA